MTTQGLNQFAMNTDTQGRVPVYRKQLRVCVDYNNSGGNCRLGDCESLHICADWVLSQCPSGTGCPKNHRFRTESIKLLECGFDPRDRAAFWPYLLNAVQKIQMSTSPGSGQIQQPSTLASPNSQTPRMPMINNQNLASSFYNLNVADQIPSISINNSKLNSAFQTSAQSGLPKNQTGAQLSPSEASSSVTSARLTPQAYCGGASPTGCSQFQFPANMSVSPTVGTNIGALIRGNAETFPAINSRNICEPFLEDACQLGDRCVNVHPEGKTAFCWRYKVPSSSMWKIFSVETNRVLEEQFVDPRKDAVEAIWLDDTFGKVTVCFETMTAQENSNITFSRLETRSCEWAWYLQHDSSSNEWSEFGTPFGENFGTSIRSSFIESVLSFLTDKVRLPFVLHMAHEQIFCNLVMELFEDRHVGAKVYNHKGEEMQIRPRPRATSFEQLVQDMVANQNKIREGAEKWRTGSYQKLVLRSRREYDPENGSLDSFYRIVESAFFRNANKKSFSVHIDCVDMYVNPTLEKIFLAKKKHFEETRGKEYAKELLLFHGTPMTDPEPIMRNNFSLDSVKRTVFGFGIYFSDFPEMSMVYAKGGSLIMARVLTGRQAAAHQCPTMAANKGAICREHDTHSVFPQKDKYSSAVVIQDVDQILPVFNIHWKYDDSTDHISIQL